MTETITYYPPETKELLIGLDTLNAARHVVENQPYIKHVKFQAYAYIPNQPSDPSQNIFEVDRQEFLNGNPVQRIMSEFDPRYNLALNSEVRLRNGDMGHFQMMDLAPRKSDESLSTVQEQLGKIVVPHFGGGMILETNKSYQFLGFNLLTEQDWIDYMGRNLVTSRVKQVDEDLPRVHEFISDYRYIGWSLMRRFSGLRVTTRGGKTFDPRVVSIV